MLLTGWKEIANYLKSGVRTAQRWEDEGLPVIRLNPNHARGHVVAYSEHLDRWIKQSRGDASGLLDNETEIKLKRTQELVLSLSKQRFEIKRRVDELRRKFESLRAKHKKR